MNGIRFYAVSRSPECVLHHGQVDGQKPLHTMRCCTAWNSVGENGSWAAKRLFRARIWHIDGVKRRYVRSADPACPDPIWIMRKRRQEA